MLGPGQANPARACVTARGDLDADIYVESPRNVAFLRAGLRFGAPRTHHLATHRAHGDSEQWLAAAHIADSAWAASARFLDVVRRRLPILGRWVCQDADRDARGSFLGSG
jgi:hypothetical protein